MSDVAGQTLVLRPDVVGTVITDGAVLLDLETNYFYETNATGWAILQMFEAGTTREHVLDQCRRWGAGATDADALGKFLETVGADKLIVPSDWPPVTAETSLEVTWVPPTIQKAPEALQRIMKSAFDPTLPLAE
ncbi:MAG: PqqD family protein [Deltaproteobacteria bacterium]|nr:PqqD family protein [Deltaproteobacteria bacterium]